MEAGPTRKEVEAVLGHTVRPSKKKKPKLDVAQPGCSTSIVTFFATAGWSGFVPVAPGTAGSLVGLGLWYLLGRMELRHFTHFLVFLAIYLIGVFIAERAMKIFPEAEHNVIVIDEMLGFMIAASFVAPGYFINEGRLLMALFLVYRLFNIIKPFPMKKLDELPGGWGVMSDDVLSGVVTLLVFYLPLQGFWYVHLGLSIAP